MQSKKLSTICLKSDKKVVDFYSGPLHIPIMRGFRSSETKGCIKPFLARQHSFLTSARNSVFAIALCATLVLSAATGWGQSNPAAYNLSSGSFSFTGFASTASTAYPTSMQGWRFGSEPTSTTTDAAAADFVLSANSASVTTGSIRNEGTSGVSVLNSGSNNLGAIALSLNTTGRTSILVTWTAADMTSAAGRVNAVVLQYRVGTSGNFTDVASTTYTSSGTSAAAAQTFSNIALPAAANNQSVVQLRWLYYAVSGTGSRDRIRIDDITVSSSAAATPTITASGTLAAVNTTYGTATASPTSFTVSGANMSAGITVTPPSGFEVSQTAGGASGYAGSGTAITVGSSGTIASTTVYVRLAATAAVASSPFVGNVVLSSSGATSVNVPTASSTVTAKGLTIAGLSAANKNWDGNTAVSVTGTPFYQGLANNDSFSVTGTVTWAFPDANVGSNKTLTRTGNYNAPSSNYTVTQPTLTASITAVAPGAPTGLSVTPGNGQLTASFTAPASNGGSAITNYEYSTNGGSSFTAVSPASTSTSIVIPALSNGTSYNVQVRAVNAAGSGTPTASVAGTPVAPSSPTITVTPATLASALSTTYGTASSTANFTVSGSTLSGNLTVTAPTGLEVSLTEGSGYGDSLNLTATSGTVSATTVYARLKATAAAGNYNNQAILISGGSADAQNISTTSNGNTVAPKAVTITGLSATGKVYDGTTSVTIAGAASYSGLANGESHSVTDSVTWTFPDKNVGAGKVLSRSASYTAPNANYSLSAQPSLTADITAKELTGSFTASNKAFDNSTVATVASRAVGGAIDGDTVNHTGGTATFDNINVGNGKTVTLASATLTGVDAGNYTLTSVSTTTADITQGAAEITFAALPAGKKVGDAAFSAGATATLGTISYSSSNTAVATVNASTGLITLVAPGVTTITANVAGTANYNAAAPASQTLNVGQNGMITDILPKLYLTARNTPSGISNWTIINAPIDNGGTDYWKMINTTAVLTSPAFDLTPYTAASCVIKLGTFGTANAAKQTITITISTDDGLTWLPLTTRTPTTSGSTAMATIDISTYNTSSLVRLRFANTGGDSSTGVRFFEAYMTGTTSSSGITKNGTFAELSSTYGTASTASATTVTVTGGSLTANITATAPTGFEVSSDGTTYGETATFTQSGGFASGTLYLRLAASAAVGEYNSQVVTLTSTGASNQTVAIANSSVSAAFAGAPTITGITAGDQQLSVAFTAPASSGGASITNYEYSLDGGSTWVTPSPAVTTSPLLITGLTNGTLYNVQIRAVNSAGGGTATATSQATPEAPAVPTLGVAPATLASAMATTYGTPSSTRNFTLTGAALNGTSVTVTPAPGLEVSASADFSTTIGTSISPLSLGASASISTTLYVRLAANAAAGSYNGQSISVSGGGVAVAETVATSGSGNTVAPKVVTISGLSATGKVYDGTTSVTITGTAVYGGLANGESHSVADSVTWTFPDKNIGTGKVLSRSASYTAPNANYSLSTQPSLTADITAKELTGSFTADDKAFDNSTTATVENRAVSGAIEGDTVNHTGGTASFADADVGNGKTVTLAGATLTGGDAGNYTLTSVSTTTANITQGAAAITFGALPAGKKVGDAAFSAGATTTLGTISYTSSNTAVATVNASTGSITLVAPGVTTITATVAGEANFTGATASQTLNVGGATGILTTIFSENMGTPGGTTATATHTFQNSPGSLNYSNGGQTNPADVRATSVSSGYTGASGGGNVFFTSTSGTYGFSIENINAAGTSNLQLSYGYRKESSSVHASFSVDYWNGTAWVTVANTAGALFTEAANAAFGWYSAIPLSLPAGAQIDGLKIRFVKTGTASIRIDDVKLTSAPSIPAITATGSFAAVTTTYGTASAASGTTATVTGGSLTADITATAPTGFQVSSDGTTYGSTATFTQTDGFANGTLYLRLAANAAAGSYNDQVVTLSSSGASNQTLAIGNSSVTAGSLASGDITLTPGAGNSYTASGPAGSTFTIGYAGRTANGIATTYSSSSAPTAAGYYTATATATGNYTGSNTADFHVTGPVAGNDSATKPADNSRIKIPTATLLGNDSRIHSDGSVLTDNLAITAVSQGTGTAASISGAFVLFTPSVAGTDSFSYTVTDAITGKTATGTITVTTEAAPPSFDLQIVGQGTASYNGTQTSITMDFIGVPNQSYTVEYKGDLAEASWTSAGAQSTGSTGSFSVTFTKAGDHTTDWNGSMFFRASVTP
jgi:YDG domain/Fibronectin type III domain